MRGGGVTAGATGRAEALRREFDASFAAAPPGAPPPLTALLALRTGGEPYAVRLSGIDRIVRDLPITPLPCDARALLGLGSIGDAPVPVYDLGLLLDGRAGRSPRWTLLAAGGRVALAFDEFEGHLRVGAECLTAGAAGEGTRACAPDLLSDGERVVPVASMEAVLRAAGVRERTAGDRGEG